MKKLVSWLVVLGFVTPLGIQIVVQMMPEARLGWQFVRQQIAMVSISSPLVIASAALTLVLWTRTGWRLCRRIFRKLSWWAYEFLYHNTRQRLGRFMAFLWLSGWIGLGLTSWIIVQGHWLGLALMIAYWGGLLCTYYLYARFQKWQFLRFRLPGRFHWRGIGQEAKDAGVRLAHSFRRNGLGRRYGP
jgi:hypothetical protein